MKIFWRIRTLKRNWIINNTKHFSNLWKRKQRKTITQILLIHTNIISKKRGMWWKRLLETRVTNAPLPNVITVKNREIFNNNKIAETFNNYFVNVSPNLAAFIPKNKTKFQNYIHYNGPCLNTINHTVLELESAFASPKTNKSSGYDDISVKYYL